VSLVQLVRFLVVELTHPDLNPRFDISIIFMTNYFLMGGDVPINNETLLVTDFVNLKIKPAQSFRCVHMCMVCVRVFIRVSVHLCMSICVVS
jgi:hypothetical protein